MKKTINGGASTATFVTPPENGAGNWVTPYSMDPNNSSIIYAGYTDLYRHDNAGISGSWVNTTTGITFTSKLHQLEMCPSNSDVIYASTTSTIYKSSNITSASPTWTTLSFLCQVLSMT